MFDLEVLSLKELRDLRAKLDRAIASFEERNRRDALAAAEEAARTHGFSLKDLTGSTAAGRRSPKSAPKYANPQNSTQTWSGRGRQPHWVKDAMQAGMSLVDLKI